MDHFKVVMRKCPPKFINLSMLRISYLFFVTLLCIACSPGKQIARSAKKNIIEDSALVNAHVGISIYEPATGKYLYNFQGDKYFVPASNTKIPTCYAAMKYLGDSLVGARYEQSGGKIYIYGTADPSFCHPAFKFQPVLEFARSRKGQQVSLIQNTDSNYNLKKHISSLWKWVGLE